MKPRIIIALASKDDNYQPAVVKNAISVPLFKHDVPGKKMFDTNVFDLIRSKNLPISSGTMDLLNLAILAYTCDQLISRAADGYMGWSRHFKVHFPVHNLGAWTDSKKTCEKMLSYLSGDKWELVLRQNKSKIESQQLNLTSASKTKPSKVVLFSGGLDSFIGAIDVLEEKNPIAIVSHYKLGGSESKIQYELCQELSQHYGLSNIEHFQFYMQPNQSNQDANKENSSRARSFLFLCLGTAIANCYSANTPLLVPENGLISLNVPLTLTRLGSHSTRTTHPYYLYLFNELLNLIGIPNKVGNPFQLKTKGEMIAEVSNPTLFKKLYSKTMSCAHPDISRWKGASPNQHCGYCVPCIIRRASTNAAKLNDKDYFFNITDSTLSISDKGPDYKAFQIAFQKIKRMSAERLSFHILASGPIQTKTKLEFQKYVDLYKRGMNEVEYLINNELR